ncbi:MAG TPA: glycosyltransferase family 4 protein [Candidatus Limnocylindrales bacterium]|nr:glycosyltransferase family 4 protein [Candidatus Limnocylindrales bacterium]
MAPVRESPSRAVTRVLALFPELLGPGGVQESGRLTALALSKIASDQEWSTTFLSLNDPKGIQSFSIAGKQVPFMGFDRSKLHFALSVLRKRSTTRLVLAAHPYLAVPAVQMKVANPSLKIVVMSHGVEVWKPLPRLRRGAFRRCDLFLAPSRCTAESIAKFQGIQEERIVRLPWPLNPDLLHIADRSAGLPVPADFPKGIIVLAVARLAASERYKGIDRLILATANLRTKIPDLSLVVVGGGDDLERHKQLARDADIADRVRFFDDISSADLAAFYAHADVFALPSTGEGFGFVFLEAMAFAKSVIGVRAGGVPDIIANGENGLLVEAGDSNGLQRALENLLINERLRSEMGQRGAQIVRAEYQFATFRSRIREILNNCLLESKILQ